MALTLTQALAKEWMTLNAETRQQGFFDYLTSTLCVWGLKGEDGWIMMAQRDGTYLPVWSHEILATLWAEQHHPDANTAKISLITFKEEWVPGLLKNEIGLVISPSNISDEAILMSAKEVMDALG